ncbi:rhamnulokinase [Tuberibacillus sp. Marseille-P3662]|uniref:rhamnulokinase n=1 Tax=Tuberibacillus sp. Marseille-P3662 TaxID=1965358 RepID=UPI000A1CBF6A|nr:rhamnulokinase family protein [Tuberibacillus sp. Marseille-P3662]
MNVLAFDIGASSGRAVIGHLDGHQLKTQEVHRFSNDPVEVGGHLHWDILRLFHEVKQGILQAKHQGYDDIQSLAIDTWAVDFGLLDQNGELLGNPYHYRDHRTDHMIDEVRQHLSEHDIFSRTGIQFMQINTLYHLYAQKKANVSLLQQADTFLMIPDLLRYFLTGTKQSEFTNATTTQLFHAFEKKWDDYILEQLGLPTHIFTDPVAPGTVVGELLPSIRQELGVSSIPVMTVGEHDTASAVAAVPTDQQTFAYLSCGTWSLLGTEVDAPVINQQAFEWNFTNEGGVNDTYRLLKNIMGLWIIQECQNTWEKAGEPLSYDEMNDAVKHASPFQSFIDPDHVMFLNPLSMPEQVQQYCRDTHQHVPETKGGILRSVLESLALKYRFVLERLETLADTTFSGLHMVGGGINNEILCQFTANAIQRPVYAGPVEATSLGNLLTQYQGLGHIKGIEEARWIVRESYPFKTFTPQDEKIWEQAYQSFCHLINE